MTNTPLTLEQKKFLAQQLPELIREDYGTEGDNLHFEWMIEPIKCMTVRDTEWLFVVRECEGKLSMGKLVEYGKLLNRMDLTTGNYGYVERVINASESQRCAALMEVMK